MKAFIFSSCVLSLIFVAKVNAAENSTGKVANTSLSETASSKSGETVAQISAVEAPAAPKKWTASFDSYFYDFEGKTGDKHGLYAFGDVRLKLQMMMATYQMDAQTTLMMALPYIDNEVVTFYSGVPYRDYSRGLGDFTISANRFLGIYGGTILMADAGLSLPTGGISEKNVINTAFNYPYNMQLGSGTIDPILGFTALKMGSSVDLGTHVLAIVRTGQKNLNEYHLGNQYRMDAWANYNLNSIFQARLVGYHKTKQGIEGQDKTLGRPASLEFYHHDQMNWDVSAALAAKQAISKSVSLSAEIGVPVAQGSQNWDDVEVITQYYGKFSVSGSF